MNRKTVWMLDRNDHVLINGQWCRVDTVARGPEPKFRMIITVISDQTGPQTLTLQGTDTLPVYSD